MEGVGAFLVAQGKVSACNAGESLGMTTHSCVLPWRIPWTEEPGRLQSMESQRVRHIGATNTFTFSTRLHKAGDSVKGMDL